MSANSAVKFSDVKYDENPSPVNTRFEESAARLEDESAIKSDDEEKPTTHRRKFSMNEPFEIKQEFGKDQSFKPASARRGSESANKTVHPDSSSRLFNIRRGE